MFTYYYLRPYGAENGTLIVNPATPGGGATPGGAWDVVDPIDRAEAVRCFGASNVAAGEDRAAARMLGVGNLAMLHNLARPDDDLHHVQGDPRSLLARPRLARASAHLAVCSWSALHCNAGSAAWFAPVSAPRGFGGVSPATIIHSLGSDTVWTAEAHVDGCEEGRAHLVTWYAAPDGGSEHDSAYASVEDGPIVWPTPEEISRRSGGVVMTRAAALELLAARNAAR